MDLENGSEKKTARVVFGSVGLGFFFFEGREKVGLIGLAYIRGHYFQ